MTFILLRDSVRVVGPAHRRMGARHESPESIVVIQPAPRRFVLVASVRYQGGGFSAPVVACGRNIEEESGAK